MRGTAHAVDEAVASARRFGPRALLSAVGALVVAVPMTVLTALVLTGSRRLQDVDDQIAAELHTYVIARPDLANTLQVIQVVTHPWLVRATAGGIAVVLWVRRQRRTAVWLATATAVGGALSFVLKEAVARARPSFPEPISLAPGYSFPSGHALQSLLFGICIAVVTHEATRGRPWLRTAVWTGGAGFTLLTGYDRIALGVHYTSDVLAGWMVAIATACVTIAVFHPLAASHQSREEHP